MIIFDSNMSDDSSYNTQSIDNSWSLPFCRMHLVDFIDKHGMDVDNDTTNKSNATFVFSSKQNLPNLTEVENPSTLWFQVLLPSMCVLGISGNLLNLIILTRKRFSAPMGKLEQCANIGLVGLAWSDLLFCVAVVPYSFVYHLDYSNLLKTGGYNLFVLYYKVYGISLINVFIMSSSWLIVALAVERYTVLYYPLHAKLTMSRRRSTSVVFVTYLMCFICTLPYFLHKEVRSCISIVDGLTRHEIYVRFNVTTGWTMFLEVYIQHVWPVIAVFLPQTILLMCNIKLVQGLRLVHVTRQLKCPGQKIRDVNARITLTLVIIVGMAIVLVTPAEILKAVNPYRLWGETGFILASVANLLQTFNFASNFVLYCTLDRHFRQICRGLFLGPCRTESPRCRRQSSVLVMYRQGAHSSIML